MFGYIKAFKPELRIKEYEVYRGVYCSLCRELGRNFGPFARFTLNYDFTFFALLQLGLQEATPEFKPVRCPFNPLKRCHHCHQNGASLYYAAHAAMILVYYQCRDHWQDAVLARKLPLAFAYPFLALAHRKAAKRYPRLEEQIAAFIHRQNEVEQKGSNCIDEAAEPTAKALSELLEGIETSPDNRRVLQRLGYCLGRWIYLADAMEDMEKDLKSGNYNPFVCRYSLRENVEQLQAAKEYANAVLNVTAGEAVKAFSLLDLKRYEPILHNILYDGIANTQLQILQGKGAAT